MGYSGERQPGAGNPNGKINSEKLKEIFGNYSIRRPQEVALIVQIHRALAQTQLHGITHIATLTDQTAKGFVGLQVDHSDPEREKLFNSAVRQVKVAIKGLNTPTPDEIQGIINHVIAGFKTPTS